MAMLRCAYILGLFTTASAGCGAWEFHQAGIPIDKVPPPAKCTANPNCPPNDGNCCPTPGHPGAMLDCCNIYSCECKLHPQCVYENKTGNCCPNAKGHYEDCCSNFRAAVNNPACVKAKVKGNACPDEHGKYDKCCHESAKCSYKNQCPGLAGDCCPTPGGGMLGCCLKKEDEEITSSVDVEPSVDEWYRRRHCQYCPYTYSCHSNSGRAYRCHPGSPYYFRGRCYRFCPAEVDELAMATKEEEPTNEEEAEAQELSSAPQEEPTADLPTTMSLACIGGVVGAMLTGFVAHRWRSRTIKQTQFLG